eukprot:gene7654-1368_t
MPELRADRGGPYRTFPMKTVMEAGKTYMWCACGRSKTQSSAYRTKYAIRPALSLCALPVIHRLPHARAALPAFPVPPLSLDPDLLFPPVRRFIRCLLGDGLPPCVRPSAVLLRATRATIPRSCPPLSCYDIPSAIALCRPLCLVAVFWAEPNGAHAGFYALDPRPLCAGKLLQPFCDGSHKDYMHGRYKPVPYKCTQTVKAALCACKQTNNPPFCDKSHVPFLIRYKAPVLRIAPGPQLEANEGTDSSMARRQT